MCYQSFARIAKTFDKNPNGKLIKIKSFIKSAEKLDRRRRRLVRLYYARISLFPRDPSVNSEGEKKRERKKRGKKEANSRDQHRSTSWPRIHHLFRSSGKNIREITISRRWITRFIRVLSKLGWGIHKFVRYIAATFAIYSSPVSLSRLSLSLPRLELDLNFKRNATAHGLRDETVARGEGGGGKERERKGEGRGRERIVESSRMATYTRCCRGFWGWGVDEREVLKCSLILGLIFGILLFLEESIYFDSLFWKRWSKNYE